MREEIIQALAFSAPAICAMVCLTIMLFEAFFTQRTPQQKQLHRYMSTALAIAPFCWLGLIFQVLYPRAFVYYQSLFLLTLMLDQTLMYRVIHTLTATEKRRKLSCLHFVLPMALTTIWFIGTLTVPFDQQLIAIYSKEPIDKAWFSALCSLTGIIFIVYNALYPILGLLRVRHYKRYIFDYSADTQRTSLGWLLLMQALTLITIPIPLMGMLLNIDVFSSFWFSMQGVLPTIIIYPILCYNLLSDNYVIIEPAEQHEPMAKFTDIDPKRFEKYIKEKKPYLNSKLRITDVAAQLCTNRSYVSAFINREYGINFCLFINRCRLKELDQLRMSASSEEYSSRELVIMAGFSSYSGYLRVKNNTDNENLINSFQI